VDRWPQILSIPVVGAGLALTACATPRLHSVDELNRIGLTCNLAAGELVQEPELKKVVILFREAPTPAERSCVHRWARKNHLRLTIIEAVTYSE
jgi:hypothetical protein